MATKYAPYLFLACVVSSGASLFGYLWFTQDKEDPLPGPSGQELPKGRYVKLVQTVAQDTELTGLDDINKIIQFAELEVFAPGSADNLALGKTGSASTEKSGFPLSALVDGDSLTFASTHGREVDEFDYLQIDLGSVQEIEKIKIKNRDGPARALRRAIGVKAVILGEDGQTVITETPAIDIEAITYTFTFPGTAWVL